MSLISDQCKENYKSKKYSGLLLKVQMKISHYKNTEIKILLSDPYLSKIMSDM